MLHQKYVPSSILPCLPFRWTKSTIWNSSSESPYTYFKIVSIRMFIAAEWLEREKGPERTIHFVYKQQPSLWTVYFSQTLWESLLYTTILIFFFLVYSYLWFSLSHSRYLSIFQILFILLQFFLYYGYILKIDFAFEFALI